MKRFVLFSVLIALLSSCEGYDYRLIIKNNSPHDLYVIDYDTNDLSDYPNLTLDRYLVLSGSKKKHGSFGNADSAWEDRIRDSRNAKLNVFAIKKEIVDSLSRDEIIKQKLYYYKKSFTLQEIKSQEWIVEIK